MLKNKFSTLSNYLYNKDVVRNFAGQVVVCGRVNIANETNTQHKSSKVQLRRNLYIRLLKNIIFISKNI